MFGLSTLATRIALGVIAVVLLLGFLQVRSCQQARQKAAQSRVERAQGKAALESAKDAIATQGAAQAEQEAIEAKGEEHEDVIRAAPGADQALDRNLNRAARSRMCDYSANRNKPECRVLSTPSSGVAGGR